MARAKTKTQERHSRTTERHMRQLKAYAEKERAASFKKILTSINLQSKKKSLPLPIRLAPDLFGDSTPRLRTQRGVLNPWQPLFELLANLHCMDSLGVPYERGDNFDRSQRNPVMQFSPRGDLIGFNQFLRDEGKLAQLVLANNDFRGGIPFNHQFWMAGGILAVLGSDCSSLVRNVRHPFSKVTITADIELRGLSKIVARTSEPPTGLAVTDVTVSLDVFQAGLFRTLDSKSLTRVEGVVTQFNPNGYDLGDKGYYPLTLQVSATVPAADAFAFEDIWIRVESSAGVTRGSNLEASLYMLHYATAYPPPDHKPEIVYVPGIKVPAIVFDFCPR